MSFFLLLSCKGKYNTLNYIRIPHTPVYKTPSDPGSLLTNLQYGDTVFVCAAPRGTRQLSTIAYLNNPVTSAYVRVRMGNTYGWLPGVALVSYQPEKELDPEYRRNDLRDPVSQKWEYYTSEEIQKRDIRLPLHSVWYVLTKMDFGMRLQKAKVIRQDAGIQYAHPVETPGSINGMFDIPEGSGDILLILKGREPLPEGYLSLYQASLMSNSISRAIYYKPGFSMDKYGMITSTDIPLQPATNTLSSMDPKDPLQYSIDWAADLDQDGSPDFLISTGPELEYGAVQTNRDHLFLSSRKDSISRQYQVLIPTEDMLDSDIMTLRYGGLSIYEDSNHTRILRSSLRDEKVYYPISQNYSLIKYRLQGKNMSEPLVKIYLTNNQEGWVARSALLDPFSVSNIQVDKTALDYQSRPGIKIGPLRFMPTEEVYAKSLFDQYLNVPSGTKVHLFKDSRLTSQALAYNNFTEYNDAREQDVSLVRVISPEDFEEHLLCIYAPELRDGPVFSLPGLPVSTLTLPDRTVIHTPTQNIAIEQCIFPDDYERHSDPNQSSVALLSLYDRDHSQTQVLVSRYFSGNADYRSHKITLAWAGDMDGDRLLDFYFIYDLDEDVYSEQDHILILSSYRSSEYPLGRPVYCRYSWSG